MKRTGTFTEKQITLDLQMSVVSKDHVFDCLQRSDDQDENVSVAEWKVEEAAIWCHE